MQQHFAHVGGPALGCDGPHHVSQILGAIVGGGLHPLHLRIDFDHTLLALHPGFTARLEHQCCSPEIDVGRSAAVMVINRFGGARHHGDAIDGHRPIGHPGPILGFILLAGRVGRLRRLSR